MARKRIDLETVGHLIAAAALLLKGFDKLGHGHVGIGLTLLASGALVLSFLVYAMRTGRGHHFAKAALFLFEALAMALISSFYFEEGKHYIQYATMAAGAMYLWGCIRTLIRHANMRKETP